MKEPQDSALISRMAEVFKALSDPTRLKLIGLLANRKKESFCVMELAKKLGVSQPAASQHLRVLKQIGLVISERRGFHVYCSIELKTMKEILNNVEYLYQLAFADCRDEGQKRK